MWGIGNKRTMKTMNKYQKINHFPGCWNMGRKDNLWMNLSKMKRKFPREYDFVPNTYLLAYDYDR
jgi:tubulin polyglutamylase TTLL4